MSTDLIQRTFDGTNVRVVTGSDGEPWFVAMDVCAALAIVNGRDAVSRLDDDGVGSTDIIDSLGRTQTASTINESGLYQLIFQSRRPEARRFKRWVTHDVLPSIRRTGSYAVPASREERLALAVIDAQAMIEEARQQVAALTPSAKAWDHLASTDGDYSIAEAATTISRDPAIRIGQKRLFDLLESWGWIYRKSGEWRAYQRSIETNRLATRARSHHHPRTGELILDAPQIRVTVKGLGDIRSRLAAQLEAA